MEKENVLYSELKQRTLKLLEVGEFPDNVVFAGGSAFLCRNVENTLRGYVNMIDASLTIVEPTGYDKQERIRMKDRLQSILEALKNPENCNVDIKQWREDKGRFSNFKPEY